MTCRKDVAVFLWLCVCLFMSNPIMAQSSRSCGFLPQALEKEHNVTARETAIKEGILYIPVIFHIVYNGEVQNISNEQIHSQLQVINEDFSLQNENATDIVEVFKPLAADVGVQFYQANIEGGITRTATSHGPFFDDDLHLTSQGGRDASDTQQYLNIWVADLAAGVFGYGTSPGTESYRDGVAINFEHFGKGGTAVAPYDQGRTLTHEIGHWLGLLHPWGNGGCDSDDGLSDTPAQEIPLAGCQLTSESCTSLDMAQNFMNTSEDACLALFTAQQRDFMRSTLINDRPEVYTLDGIITGVTQKEPNQSRMTLYPNPVTDTPYIYANILEEMEDEVDINIIDAMGRNVRQVTNKSVEGQLLIDLSGLDNGWYTTQLSDSQSIYSSKIYLKIE